MRRTLFAACAMASLAAAAPGQCGVLSYGMKLSDATIVDQGRTFRIYIHPKADRLLLQPSLAEALNGGTASKWPIAFWRHAAETFVAPLGCGISDVEADFRAGASWEAAFVCPVGVDLRAIITAERPELKAGEPLHPLTPPPQSASAGEEGPK